MSNRQDSNTGSRVRDRGAPGVDDASGWTTDAELVREFDRPVDVTDAVVSTVTEAIGQWPELSETPPLHQFVDVESVSGLFKTKATDDSERLPSVKFQFQNCQVTLLYGSSIRVIIERDR